MQKQRSFIVISSQNNIVFRRDKEGHILGIIIDFDLATVTDTHSELFRVSPSLYEITGTLPFMAIDRLTSRDKTHWPRHDLESFFWLIVLFISRHHEAKAVDNPPFQEWYQCGAKSLAKTKALFLRDVEDQHPYIPTPHFQPLVRAWVDSLVEIFNDGSTSRRRIRKEIEAGPADYSYETLGGLITHKTFLAILRAEIAA